MHECSGEVHHDVATALEALEERHFGTLIADYLLEGQSTGADLVCAAIARHPELNCVIMSGNTANIETAKLPAGVRLLQKPFSVQEFVSKVLRD